MTNLRGGAYPTRMKKFLFALLVSAAALCGCSTPTRVTTGRIQAATFSFIRLSKKDADFSDQRLAVHEAVQAAIVKNLESKGLAFAKEGGDVTVAYLLIVGNNVATKAINDYFGYDRDDYELAERAHRAIAVQGQNPNYVEVGTLLIDVLDGRTHKLLARNFAYSELLRDLPDDVRAVRLQEAVDHILRDVQIAK